MTAIFDELVTRQGFLDAIEAATGNRPHPRTVRRWEIELGLPVICRGKYRFYKKSEIQAWLRGERPRRHQIERPQPRSRK